MAIHHDQEIQLQLTENHNKLFKSDSQCVALSLCVVLSV
ncbi:hypothetical protein VCHA34O109_470001 [Vibrio chagasii]|nr:hypothetical protein VCHA34O109_470001 [Vibrio chagasii]